MNNSGQLFFLAFTSFLASLRACSPTSLMLVPSLFSTLWIETQMICNDNDTPAHLEKLIIHVITTFTAVSRLIDESFVIHSCTEKTSIKTLTHKESSWLYKIIG